MHGPIASRTNLAAAFALWMAVSVPAWGQSAPAAPPPDFQHVDHLDGYHPIEDVPGAPGALPLAVAKPAGLALAAEPLAQAQAYSDSSGGLALLVWQGGALRYEQYAPGHDAGTRFETFSMHKSILALVYGAAIRDGIIHSLDDPAGKYLEEWTQDPRGQITLRQLLSMESGLHFYSFKDPEAVQIGMGTEVTATALASPADHPPGAVFQYNNADYQIAGHILNKSLKKAGQGDYAAYVSRVLLKPLGAGDAHLWLEHEGGDPRFFAHFQMRAPDWVRIGVMIAHGGTFEGKQILPATWIKQITEPTPRNPNYGLGIWIGSPWSRYSSYGQANPVHMSHEKPYLAEDLIYFDGFGGERVYISPRLDLVIVRIGQPSMTFDDSIIPNDIVTALRHTP